MSDKTLPQRMREAAETLSEATPRHTDNWLTTVEPDLFAWSPAFLKYTADRFEKEDQENPTEKALVEFLNAQRVSPLLAPKLLANFNIEPK